LRVAWELVATRSRPLVPEADPQDTELRHLAQSRSLAVLAIAVVLIYTARNCRNTLLCDRDVARSNSEPIVGLRSVNRGSFGDWRSIRVFFRVVVVVGVGLHIKIEVVA